MSARGRLLALVLALPSVAGAGVADDGMDAARWRALGSDDVEAVLAPPDAAHPGTALRYDFHHRAGYAGLEREFAVDWPENFELDLELDGHVEGNDLEIKFVDDSGDNVWWYRRRATTLEGPTTLRIRRRQVEFAWGPVADHSLNHTARLQVIVNAVRGGEGVLGVGRIRLVPRPAVPAVPPQPVLMEADGVPLPSAQEGREAAWTCTRRPCSLTVDSLAPREFGGLTLDWARRPPAYVVEASEDGKAWRLLGSVAAAGPAPDRLWLPESEARYVRIQVPEGDAGLRALHFEAPAYGTDRNLLVAAAARSAPRGAFPRGFGAQSWWTLVGTDDGRHSGLLSVDGAIETRVGGPSVEPFVLEDGRIVSWADVEATPSLEGGDLPLPATTWHAPRWTLETSAFADDGEGERLWGRYRITNTSAEPLSVTLLLALRPYQVNPPAQFLNTPGGVAPLSTLWWDGRVLHAGDGTRVRPLVRPDRVTLQGFDSQAVPLRLAEPALWHPGASPAGLADRTQLGSAVLAYDLHLAPHATQVLGIQVPWTVTPIGTIASMEAARTRVAAGWRTRLGRVVIEAPDSAEASAVAAAMRTATAHLLMSRQGGLLRPGTRSYARSWIRDGAMMSAALLRLGEREAPEAYLAAYLPYLYSNGKVPCCVDARGSDPVPEHDSAGEFLYLAAEIERLGGDRALVARAWPGIEGAVGWLDGLRATTRAATGSDAEFYRGLLPPSISHEGYSAKPMHSYWDDFWALRGYTDAISLADALGHPAEAARWRAARAEFSADVRASLVAARERHHIDYVPGAADLGDFDATSTTVALAPGTGGADVPEAWLRATFERYWTFFERRRDGALEWKDYTPYEWRVVGSLVRLGERERALGALRWFFRDAKPPAWNQWPEVIGHDVAHARFIGDLPHGWVASDFLRSALDLVAYEDEADGALVLGAGLPRDWLAGRGVAVRGLVTRYGPLTYHARASDAGVELELGRLEHWPPGGVVWRLPGAREGLARVDGRAVPFTGGALRLAAPATHIHLPID